MATLLAKSWLTSIYNSINNIISNYTNGMSTIATPTSTKISTSDVNNLFTKLSAMKSDKFLSTAPSLFVSYVSVSSGSIISSTTKTSLDNQVANFNSIKCKNEYVKSNTTNSNGTCSNGYSNYLHEEDCYNCGHNSRYGGKDHTCTSHSFTCGQGCGQGTNGHVVKSHGSGIDILNSHIPA